MHRLIAFASAILLTLALAAPALAGPPARQACFGESVSAAATALGRDFGQLVASVATDVFGVGEEAQAILAGDFPDEGFPNTCND